MNDGSVDVVDERDQVVGVTTTTLAHKNAEIHRIAAIYVFDEESKLLVQLRKKNGLLDHSVGGHVDKDESYEVAAHREMGEEIGLKRDHLDFLGTFLADERLTRKSGVINIKHYFGLFETKLSGDQLKLSEREVLKMIPMKMEHIAEEMRQDPEKFSPGFLYSFNFYIQRKNLKIKTVEIK